MFFLIIYIYICFNSIEKSENIIKKFLIKRIQRNHNWNIQKEEIEYNLFQKCIDLETWINFLKKSLKPEYEFCTYIQDPNNKKLLYVFIENLKSKNIENYTINYKDFHSVNNFFCELFIKNDFTNEFFKIIMSFSDDIIPYTLSLIKNQKTICCKDFIDNFLDVFDDLTVNLKIIDSNNNILSKNCYTLLFLYNSTYDCIKNFKQIYLYVITCQRIIFENKKILYFDISDNLLEKLNKQLNDYLNVLFKKGEIFNKFSQEEKLLELFRLAKCLYAFFNRSNFTNDQIFYLLHDEIDKIKDKLIKLSLILSLINIQRNMTKENFVPKITKLIIFTYALNMFKIKKYNERTDFLIFLLCLHKNKKVIPTNFRKFNYFFYPKIEIRKLNVLVLELYYFFSIDKLYFDFDRFKYFDLNKNYNRLLCKIVCQAIKMKYKMLNFSF